MCHLLNTKLYYCTATDLLICGCFHLLIRKGFSRELLGSFIQRQKVGEEDENILMIKDLRHS
jgi:hypothetical protein